MTDTQQAKIDTLAEALEEILKHCRHMEDTSLCHILVRKSTFDKARAALKAARVEE